ncbi:MAG TPA: GFA family protein [Candidatus Binataceae bacterium]|nr:GFA family protein [Candidatus Binataceae bacterium]
MSLPEPAPAATGRGGVVELKGGCACGAVRYKLTNAPLIVHACHCRDCQRLTGSAFVINLWIEKRFVEADRTGLNSFELKGGSGQPHEVFFCRKCGTYLWSDYHGAPGASWFVRAGTLDDPNAVTPDVHIFTKSKLDWVVLPKDARAFPEFYSIKDVWPEASRRRIGRA